MATQRLTIATVAGNTSELITRYVSEWRQSSNPVQIDAFCSSLTNNLQSLQIIYAVQWVDRWLMGDLVPGPSTLFGKQYEMTVLSVAETVSHANQCGQQFVEQQIFSQRLREASDTCRKFGTANVSVVIIREVLDVSTSDEEVIESLATIPSWLVEFAANQ